MPFKEWAIGEEWLAADVNPNLSRQIVAQFTDTTQRDAQWTSPPNGAVCITTNTNTRYERLSGAWYKPNSVLARVVHSTQVVGIGTGGFDLAATGSIVIPSSRRIAVVCGLNFTSSSQGCYIQSKMDGVAQPGRLAQLNVFTGAILAGQVVLTPSGGSHTFTISIVGLAGTVTLEGTSDVCWYEVRDIGPA